MIAQTAPAIANSQDSKYPIPAVISMQESHTKAMARDAITTGATKFLRDEILNILTAAQLHGVPALCVGEISDQYRFNTGISKPPSSFSAPISGLCSAKLIAVAGERVFSRTGNMQKAYAVVPQQTRLAR